MSQTYNPELLLLQLPSAPLSSIASVIKASWPKPSPYALPYLRAMFSLSDMQSTYGADDAESIILYFLSNAAGYRGEVAKAVKAELKARIARGK